MGLFYHKEILWFIGYVLWFIELIGLFVLLTSAQTNTAEVKFRDITLIDDYDSFKRLDPNGNFDLYWNFTATDITFEAHVKTTGIVGIGIKPYGDSTPYDVVIGWVNDGETHFIQKHILNDNITYVEPQTTQHWTLLSAKEETGKTILRFSRKLKLCSPSDFTIDEGTYNILYFWNDNEVDSETILESPETMKGNKSVVLLSTSQHSKRPKDAKKFDFVSRNFEIPMVKDHYHCTIYKFPTNHGKQHIIKYEPVVTEGNERIVHHMLLYKCPGFKNYDDNLNGKGYECYKTLPIEMAECISVTFLVSPVEGHPFYFPEDVGLPIGEPEDSNVYIIEVHYHNPERLPGVKDNSGITVHYTQHLRQHDSDLLFSGVTVGQHQIVPPNYSKFIATGFCSSQCTEKFFTNKAAELTVFGVVPHAHSLAKEHQTTVISDEVEKLLYEDRHLDYNMNQEARMINKDIRIKPGDVIKTRCVYDSTHRTNVTVGGLYAYNEMCISFIFYYPRTNLGRCGSFPIYNNVLQGIVDTNESFQDPTKSFAKITFGTPHSNEFIEKLNEMDWTNTTMRKEFQNYTDTRQHLMFCVGRDGFRSMKIDRQPIPQISHPLNKLDKCKED